MQSAFPHKIRSERNAQGLTLQSLSDRCGVSVAAISSIENFGRGGATPVQVRALVAGLNLPRVWQTVGLLEYVAMMDARRRDTSADESYAELLDALPAGLEFATQ